MAHDEERADKKATGFAGLSTMVSNVEAAVKSAADHAATPDSKSPSNQAEGAPAPRETQNSNRGSSPSTAWVWFVAVLAITGIGIGIANSSRASSSSTFSSTSFDTALPYDPPPKPPTSPSPPVTVPRADSVPAQETFSATTRPTEELPPKGENLVLTTAQIRYCVAEDIRLGAADRVVNEHNSASIDRFNGLVDDYNSRCAAFRYHTGALESARNELRPYRMELEAEGVAKVSSSGVPGLMADDRVESGSTGSPGSSTDAPNNVEASRTPSADERANFNTCITGDYPLSCKHGMLTPDEAARVRSAEARNQ